MFMYVAYICMLGAEQAKYEHASTEVAEACVLLMDLGDVLPGWPVCSMWQGCDELYVTTRLGSNRCHSLFSMSQ